jgi:aldehyde dehydrogenase (NAD+)
MATMNSFQDLLDHQKRHFATGVTRSRAWRVEQLDRMGRLVGENEAALQHAIAQDFKTASQEQIFETLACLGEVAFQKSQLEAWMKPVEAPVPQALAATGHRGVVYRDPHGVALIIGPFNGPLLLLLRPAITALAAGNCCVLKLSEKLNSTSALLLALVPKYFEPEAVAAVAGHREEVTELLKLPFDFILFTGSTSTGKVIARAAAENLTPVLLELGGQNPALVDETANIKDAAKKIVWGAMAWGGQWCTSPGYAYVHESIAEEFVSEAKAALIALFGEDPKSNSDYSRIISAREVARLAGLIDPSKVIIGGRSDPDSRYLDPTIVYPVLVRHFTPRLLHSLAGRLARRRPTAGGRLLLGNLGHAYVGGSRKDPGFARRSAGSVRTASGRSIEAESLISPSGTHTLSIHRRTAADGER